MHHKNNNKMINNSFKLPLLPLIIVVIMAGCNNNAKNDNPADNIEQQESSEALKAPATFKGSRICKPPRG